MRFYAQHTELDKAFQSRFETGWQVFDREWCTEQGDVVAIAFCQNRTVAYCIRDALLKAIES